MKGAYGLLLAVALGVAAALVNFSYLARQARDVQRESFLGIKEGVLIRPGDVFRDEHLVPVELPSSGVKNLRDFAVLYADRFTVIGGNAVRQFEAGELILQQDLRTPPPEPRPLLASEREIGIPVDTRTFVPSLYKAGDLISFVVPRSRSILPPGGGTVDGSGSIGSGSGATETIGTFEIRSIGNRVASSDVSRASKIPQVQENVLNLIVKTTADGELEPKAQRLIELLLTENIRQFVVLGHPRP